MPTGGARLTLDTCVRQSKPHCVADLAELRQWLQLYGRHVVRLAQAAPAEAYQGEEPFLFVSYAHKDNGAVFPELHRLQGLGYRICYDERIDPGSEWPDDVARALDRCAFFLVFVSPRSVESKNVRNEISHALNADKAFPAVHLKDTALPRGLALRKSSPAIRSRGDTAAGKKRELKGRSSNAVRHRPPPSDRPLTRGKVR
jgi:hypothetical protein